MRCLVIIFFLFKIIDNASCEVNVILSSKKVVEGDILNVTLTAENSYLKCKLQLQPLGIARLSQYSVTFFSSLTKIVRIITEDDRIPTEDVQMDIVVSCSPSTKDKMILEQFMVIDKNSKYTYSSIIRQYVHDKKHDAFELICYDLEAHEGYFIEIFNYNLGRSSIFGQYTNGDYLNKVVLSSPIGRISINTETIKFESDQGFKWDSKKVPKLYRFGGYLIEHHGDFLILDTINSNIFAKAKFVISRLVHKKSWTPYLDVSTENVIDYSEISGIIGSIGQNSYNFYGSTTDDNGFEKVAMFNNVHFATGIRISRGGSECWLFDIRDVLYPNTIDNFLWEEDQDEIQEMLLL